MINRIREKALPFAIASLLAATPALAQNVTSSSMGGQVLNANGKPVAGATVTITHEPSGTTKVVTTNAQGRYNAQGLRVGGPFDVVVTINGQQQAERDDIELQLGQKSNVNLQVSSAASVANAQNVGGVTVSASELAQVFSPDNKGLSTNVSQKQLEATPQANRSISDIARLDPRINVTDQGSGAISANGLPNRYNRISVDGVDVGDPFGLNANGLPNQSTAISPDTIASYNISTANADVASDTVGAVVNAVTKSGTNEFHGSVYYVYRNGSKLVGDAGFLSPDDPGYHYNGFKRDATAGFTLGGPIIKDKLFFFLSAEHEKVQGIGADSANGLDPSLGDGPSTSNKVSPGDLQRVITTAKNLGLQPGSFGGSSGVTLDDKRYLAKIDWNISNNHRASLSYNRTKETLPEIRGNSSNSVGLSSYTDTKSITTDNTSLKLYDDWTENFSTETKLGYQHFVQNTNVPVQQPDITVSVAGFRSPSVNLGEEQFRHFNKVETKKSSLFFAGTYYAGDHTIKGGVYVENEKIFNLFGRTEFGQYDFDSIEQFASGDYFQYNLYQPAPGLSINDIAAQFTYRQYSPFLQDTWQVNNNLSVQYGVRVDIPDTNHKPPYNPAFQQAFGYPNNNSLGPKNKVVEPRLGFNYTFDTQRLLQLRGSFGLYQSVPPIVWIANPYQNNGVSVSTYRSFDPSSAPFSPDAHNQNIPAGSSSSVGDVDTLSPNFRLPTVWKYTLALDSELPWWGLIGTAAYQHVQTRDAIFYQAPDLGTPSGRLPDGRLQFWTIPGAAPRANGNRPNNGANPNFSTESTLLTNTHKGKADSFTLALKKPFSKNFYGNLSFTLNHTTEVNPGNSSQASSGYKYVARRNPNTNVATLADRNIHRSVKASLTWQHAFFGDYKTQVSALYIGHDGLPYTWIFSGDVNGDGISYEDPAYIPKMNDAIVSFADSRGNPASAQLVKQFQDYINSNSYLRDHRGQIASRNGAHAPWVNQLDVSFRQEVPGLFPGNKGEIRLDIHNFLNLLNNKWGDVRYLRFNTRNLAGYGGVNDQGQYIYELPSDRAGNYQPEQYVTQDAGFNPTHVISRWSATITLHYTF